MKNLKTKNVVNPKPDLKKNNVYYDSITQTVDKESGEVEVIERTVRKKVERDRFIAMYLKDIVGIVNLTSKAEFKVLIYICTLVEYNTNEIVLIKHRKELIAKETELSYSSVHNTVSRLAKKSILVRKAKGIYILNPMYFFKGEELERAKLLRLIVEYEII